MNPLPDESPDESDVEAPSGEAAAPPETISYEGMAPARAETLKSIHAACLAVYRRPALNNTMRPPCFNFFFDILESGPALGGKVDYLEVGSFQGASMVVVGSILRRLGRLGSLSSLDPYFVGGYEETPPGGSEPVRKRATPRVMKQALQLYETAGLDVEHVRDISAPALTRLIKQERTFDFIFIDGSHEKLNPMVDMALSLQLIRPGGYIMMDDSSWPDIRPVVELCKRHLKVVASDFQKNCYEIAGGPA